MHLPAAVWALFALLAAGFLLRPVLAWTQGRKIVERALARQPETIHLQAASASAADRPGRLEAWAQSLVAEGFADAGWFTIPEMPEWTVRLLAHEPEGWLCILYEHARAGQWLEINARFPDGSRTIFTNGKETGLSPLPGVTMTRLPGGSPVDVFMAARTSRATSELTPLVVNASTAPKVFEEGYAALTAARRAQGISRAEVLNVALRPPLAKGKRVA